MKTLLTILISINIATQLSAQITFVDSTHSLVYENVSSGSPIAIADMNGDGLDDLVRLEMASDLRIEYQLLQGGFSGYTFGNLMGNNYEWGICIADVDENGYNDLITGGSNNDLKLLKANATGTTYTQSLLPSPPDPPAGIFLQACNFADINNDGAIDYFACDDIGLSAPYRGNNAGTFVWDTTLINPYSTIPSDNSGNYGSVWTDYDWDGDLDLYISKCRQGVTDTMDGRRLNLMFENDGSNTFTEVAEEIGLRPFAQSWSTDFGDLDNDGDMDAFVVMHDQISPIYINEPSVLYYNDGTDHFIAMNDSAGITADVDAMNLGIQVIMEDFDNDGLLDILVTNRYGTGAHRLFWNLGDMQFDHVTGVFPASMTLAIQSAAVGDLNHDGFLDILAGHAGNFNQPNSILDDDLLINQRNANHFISVRTIGDSSHINGIGARMKMVSAIGTQLRDVRSGESYGIMNSLNAHFGLDTATTVDSLLIFWPSGIKDTLLNLPADQFLTIHEGIGPCDCDEPQIRTVTTLTGSGAGSLPYIVNHACPCDSIVIDAALSGGILTLNERLMIGKNLTIKGLGPMLTEISTNTPGPAIRIQPGVQCTISDLTLTDAPAMPSTYLIENAGMLTLSNVGIITAPGFPLRFRVGSVVTGPGSVIVR